MTEFRYAPMFQLDKDDTEYRLVSKEGISVGEFEGKKILKIGREALALLAQGAFRDCEFVFRRTRNGRVAKVLTDPEALGNDEYVALQFLRNAETAMKGVLLFCQDTGTAIFHGEKGQRIQTGSEDEEVLSRGVFNTFTEENLRYSQNAPPNTYDEVNTKCNFPARIDIEAVKGAEYCFVTVAKGDGSANKTYFYLVVRATIQNEGTLIPFLVEEVKGLDAAAYPPYHIYFVIGSTSAEKNLLTVKLGSIKYYDNLPTTDDGTGRAFRGIDPEKKILREAYKIGLDAQFSGKCLARGVHIIRLPHHGANCPIGMGISCSADRNIKAKINEDGIWLEKMGTNLSESILEEYREPEEGAKGIKIDLDRGVDVVRTELTKYPVSARVNPKGTIIVARDIAYAKLKARLDAGKELPDYIKSYPVPYAGSAKTPEGYPCSSMGPAAANHMDPYVDEFQERGGSLVIIAKGNRTQAMTDTCQKHGGFYLGTIGGVAVVPLRNSIKSIECVECPELGMEAVRRITVEDFPAFILVGDKGRDFFEELKSWTGCSCEK